MKAQAHQTDPALVVVAAGSGTRFGGAKQLARLAGKPLLVHCLAALGQVGASARVVVLPKDALDGGDWNRMCKEYPEIRTWQAVAGGAQRADSVLAGLRLAAESGAEFVAIHDGARPFPPIEATYQCLTKLRADPGLAGAIVCAEVTDTIKRVGDDGESVSGTERRETLRRAETPQVCRIALLIEALAKALGSTDEASALESSGHRVATTTHLGWNVKITRPVDLVLAEAYINTTGVRNMNNPPFAVGTGYDVHRFAIGRPLILGGVTIPSDRGLDGHSDADVLLHAICDALLGAAGLPDIGHFFPNTGDEWKDADSRELLRLSRVEVEKLGWSIANIDSVLIAEKPKVAPHLEAMKQNIAADLELPIERIGIKATTNEKMGFVGREEGIAATASALLWKV